MRVAAIYDIHGNLPTLEAALQDTRQAKVDHLVVGAMCFQTPILQHLAVTPLSAFRAGNEPP
jgi:Icc-related predicted phosphoesterase